MNKRKRNRSLPGRERFGREKNGERENLRPRIKNLWKPQLGHRSKKNFDFFN